MAVIGQEVKNGAALGVGRGAPMSPRIVPLAIRREHLESHSLFQMSGRS